MFKPDDPLAPLGPNFSEGWHAQVLGLADTMVQAGYFSAEDWANCLGATLARADAVGAPDTEETYYASVLEALESLMVEKTNIGRSDLSARKTAWSEAYKRTPHGKPVTLD